MFEEGITVGAVGKRDIERFCVVERLLHPGTDRVVVVLGLDDSYGEVLLIVEKVVGLLGLASPDCLSPNDHPSLGEVALLPDLSHEIPLVSIHPDKGRGDELGADVRFGECFLVHWVKREKRMYDL